MNAAADWRVFSNEAYEFEAASLRPQAELLRANKTASAAPVTV